MDAFDHDEEVPTDGPASLVDRGMGIELSRIRAANSEESWTFGFEAFPPDPEIHEDFLRNARAFLAEFAEVANLSESNSMSYPEWLSRR